MMEFANYKGWTITTQAASRGIGAVITDPSGSTYHQVTICWQSHQSARRYAQKFIDWYIKLESRHHEEEASIRNLTVPSQSVASR